MGRGCSRQDRGCQLWMEGRMDLEISDELCERFFPAFVLITQNVDGLHRRAGSAKLLELHGTILQARCNRCGGMRDMGEALAESREEPPVCSCEGKFRPAVVWFGESL